MVAAFKRPGWYRALLGTIVQMISRRVLPWIGSPSDSSPGLARNA